MKKLNQVSENVKPAPGSAQQKPRSPKFVRVRVYVSDSLERAVKQGAKREKVTVSQFIESAIRDVLDRIEVEERP